MKWPAVLILVALLLTVAIQQLGEVANILKEKVVLNAALMNSCRAAHKNSLNIWYMMNLEAYVNENDFIQLFSDTFSESLNLTHHFDKNTNTTNQVVFTSKNSRFNDITVEFEFENTTYNELEYYDLGVTDYHDRPVTVVTLKMQTPYLFRSYWLGWANDVSKEHYLLTYNRKFLVQIIN